MLVCKGDINNKMDLSVLSKKQINYFYSYVSRLKTIISKIRKNPLIQIKKAKIQYDGKTLQEILSCSSEELELCLEGLYKSSASYKAFMLACKNDINNKLDLSVLPKEDKQLISGLYIRLNKKLQKLREQSIVRNILYKVFGPNLDQEPNLALLTAEELNLYNKLQRIHALIVDEFRKGISTPTNDTVEILALEEYEGAKTPLNHPIFKYIADLMPADLKNIVKLRLGLYDGNIYDVNKIASILNLDESSASLMVEKSVILYKGILYKYLALLNEEPKFTQEIGCLLKLIK